MLKSNKYIIQICKYSFVKDTLNMLAFG